MNETTFILFFFFIILCHLSSSTFHTRRVHQPYKTASLCVSNVPLFYVLCGVLCGVKRIYLLSLFSAILFFMFLKYPFVSVVCFVFFHPFSVTLCILGYVLGSDTLCLLPLCSYVSDVLMYHLLLNTNGRSSQSLPPLTSTISEGQKRISGGFSGMFLWVQGTGEGSDYQKPHKTTLENPLDSHERFVIYM